MAQHLSITAYDGRWSDTELQNFSTTLYVHLMHHVDNDEQLLIDIYCNDEKEWDSLIDLISAQLPIPKTVVIEVVNQVH